MDNTQITTITEPDVEAATTAAAAPAPATTAATTTSLALAPIREITTSRPRSLTREEARQVRVQPPQETYLLTHVALAYLYLTSGPGWLTRALGN